MMGQFHDVKLWVSLTRILQAFSRANASKTAARALPEHLPEAGWNPCQNPCQNAVALVLGGVLAGVASLNRKFYVQTLCDRQTYTQTYPTTHMNIPSRTVCVYARLKMDNRSSLVVFGKLIVDQRSKTVELLTKQ